MWRDWSLYQTGKCYVISWRKLVREIEIKSNTTKFDQRWKMLPVTFCIIKLWHDTESRYHHILNPHCIHIDCLATLLCNTEIFWLQLFLYNTTLEVYWDPDKGKVIADSVIITTLTAFIINLQNMSILINFSMFYWYVSVHRLVKVWTQFWIKLWNSLPSTTNSLSELVKMLPPYVYFS